MAGHTQILLIFHKKEKKGNFLISSSFYPFPLLLICFMLCKSQSFNNKAKVDFISWRVLVMYH